jgi:acetyl-CoA acetyltransferase
MEDAGLSYDGDKDAIGGIWYGNCVPGMFTSQHSIRGQVILRRLKFEKMPIVNVENACASATTALNQAVASVLGEMADLAMAVGVEKKMTLDQENLTDFPELKAVLPFMAAGANGIGKINISKIGEDRNQKLSAYPMSRRMWEWVARHSWIT